MISWRTGPQLDRLTRRYQYLARTSVAGLEFFGTTELAEKDFQRVDRIILPHITGEPSSSLVPVPASAALLKLAEQSMYFQLWKHDTPTAIESSHSHLPVRHLATDYWRALTSWPIPCRVADVLEQGEVSRES